MMLTSSLPCGCMSTWRRVEASRARNVAAAAKRNKPQQKRQRKPKGQQQRISLDFDDDDDDDYGEGERPAAPASRLPAAPQPAARPAELPPRPQDIYPVFLKDPVVTKMEDRSSKWSWGDESASAPEEPPVPQWNPRTGFMRTRAQAEAEQRAAEAAAAAAAAAASSSGGGGGEGGGAAARAGAEAPAAATAAGAGGAGPSGAAPLAAVSKGQVLGSCLGTTAVLGVLAAVIRAYASQSAAGVLGTDPDLLARLLELPPGLESAEDAAVMLAAAGAVTGARLLLLDRWGALRDATDASNRQVLAPLGWADVAFVSLMTGVSEELLFRGTLIPASWPDWRGLLLSAVVFGALHNSGGRNAAFAAWAAGVGAAYGAAYLYTENIWVAAGAHCIANFASAAVWIGRNSGVGRIAPAAAAPGGSGGRQA